MPRVTLATRSILVAATVGALSLGSAGIAAGAAPTTAPTTASPAKAAASAAAAKARAAYRQRLCTKGSKALSHLQAREAAIATELRKLDAAAHTAAKTGHPHRAKLLYTKFARLQKVSLKNRLYRASSRVKSKCGPAPTAH
jgi:hypothetical protein